MFSVRLSNKSEKQLAALDPGMRLRVEGLLAFLAEDPVPAKAFDLKKIGGESDAYRIRLSSFRVLYRIYWQEKKIRIVKIERRSDNTYD